MTAPAPDVVALCSALIAIDTSNFGRTGSRGERTAANYVAAQLHRVGYETVLLESEPTRANLILRVPGIDPTLPALLVHGHLDVVPAVEDQWSVPPFEGRVEDGFLWGRGAMDMKDMVAMMVATMQRWARDGDRPRRDLVFAFVADEEEDGALGAQWLVDNHPGLFENVAAAVSEVGGHAVPVADPAGKVTRFYPICVAERGSRHMRVTARGTAGHGSRPNPDNPVLRLLRALGRVTDHEWPMEIHPPAARLLDTASRALGLEVDLSSAESVEGVLDRLGELRDYVEPSLRASTTVTVLDAGYKYNVVPSEAHAEIDVRTLPGSEDHQLAVIDELLGEGITRQMISDRPALVCAEDTEWFDAMRRTLLSFDPDAVVVPFCMGGGTDNKPFAQLGITGYGFAPRGDDPDGRRWSGAHGVDERIPVASLVRGREILDRFLLSV